VGRIPLVMLGVGRYTQIIAHCTVYLSVQMRCQELIDETLALREQLESKQQQEKKTKRDREAQLKSDLEKALVANSVFPLPAHVRIIMFAHPL